MSRQVLLHEGDAIVQQELRHAEVRSGPLAADAFEVAEGRVDYLEDTVCRERVSGGEGEAGKGAHRSTPEDKFFITFFLQ